MILSFFRPTKVPLIHFDSQRLVVIAIGNLFVLAAIHIVQRVSNLLSIHSFNNFGGYGIGSPIKNSVTRKT